MYCEYVLVNKKEKEDKSLHLQSKSIKSSLETCFQDVTKSTFKVLINKKTYLIKYNCVRCKAVNTDKNDIVYNFHISFNSNTRMHEAKVLEIVHNAIGSCVEIKSAFYFIVAYDGISSFYCNKAYPYAHEFERQLRHFVFKLLTKSFGTLWLDKTIDENLKNDLKKSININNKAVREEKLIEMALYEMSAYQLETYLFRETRDIEYDVYSFEREELEKYSKDELIELVEKGRTKTLWDRYFDKEIHIADLKSKLEKIRKYRNSIAHSKHFHLSEYTDFFAVVNELNEKIKIGLDKIEIVESRSLLAQEALCGFADALIHFGNIAVKIGESIAPIMSTMANIGAALYDVYQNSVPAQLSGAVEVAQQISRITPVIPTPIIPKQLLGINLDDVVPKSEPLINSMNQNQGFLNGLEAKSDCPTFIKDIGAKNIDVVQRAANLLQPKFPALDSIRRQQQMLDQIIKPPILNFGIHSEPNTDMITDEELDYKKEKDKTDFTEDKTNE